MSMAASIPYIKIRNPSSPSSSPALAPASSSSGFRFSVTAKLRTLTTIRSSQAEEPLRRPVAPPLREPSPPSSLKPSPPSPPPQTSSNGSPGVSRPPPKPAPLEGSGVVTLEFQRQRAKELQDYFKQKKIEESNQGPFFGFLPKNEISNGRWAMFGFAVGMLTEYATGSDFVDQMKILLSNFGIIDLE